MKWEVEKEEKKAHTAQQIEMRALAAWYSSANE